MRASILFLRTKRERPAGTDLISHTLMLKAGMISQVAAGIYSYLPLGLRCLRKAERVVRQELEAAGYAEVLMPFVQPAELWEESGRWDKIGAELFRVNDRGGRRFALQATSEELATDLVRHEIKSHRDLPVRIFQIQSKARDERRPRFGLIRTREFIMKDGYSFHADGADLDADYTRMYESYLRIFSRIGLNVRVVEADNGNIGGRRSHEFHAICKAGEDVLAYSTLSSYAANLEAAVSMPEKVDEYPTDIPDAPPMRLAEVENNEQLSACATRAHVYVTGNTNSTVQQVFVLLLRKEHSINDTKLRKVPMLADARPASDKEVKEVFGASFAWIGPVNVPREVELIVDRSVISIRGFSCGANAEGQIYRNVFWGRDIPFPQLVYDLRNVVEGDLSPDGRGVLKLEKGVEVGHIFKLDTTYSESMDATFTNARGMQSPVFMGSYGIGISRIIAAAIEQSHDELGMVWHPALAPFEVVICPLDYADDHDVRNCADKLYAELRRQHFDVVIDDRPIRPGLMFSDWDVIGVPHRIVISKRTVAARIVEYRCRRTQSVRDIPIDELIAFLAFSHTQFEQA